MSREIREGRMQKAKGKIWAHIGRMIGNNRQVARGKLEQMHGEVKKTIGKAKKVKIKNNIGE